MMPYLQALFVTFLWSTSWVIIKVALDDIPALTFAGLRYTLAASCLLLMGVFTGRLKADVSRRDWGRLVLLGLVFYTITQGAQFLALVYLPTVTLSLLLNFSAVVVAVAAMVLLNETPSRQQWVGMAVFLVGVMIYFYPVNLPRGQWIGIGIGIVGLLANASASIMGRSINRAGTLSPFLITTISMTIGGVVLLVAGITTQGLPTLSAGNWLAVAWLALVNTAFAFTLWNLSLQKLTAVESSIINNTMMIQIALLAWVFLDERIAPLEGAGLVTAAIGILLVQVRRAVGKPS
jgi:drug/metabolite transporter (DMT)-like permease